MKAVVVELNDSFAAILSDDGCIATVKNKNYEIGQVIKIDKNKNNDIIKKITAFAASAAAFILLSTGTWAYSSPYTYVSVDVNPSIEITANRFDRVLSVRAVNDDGEDILNEIPLDDLKHHKIKNAISETVDQITEAGYFSNDSEGGIIITTSSKNTDKADALAQELQQKVEIEAEQISDSITVEAYSVGKERLLAAKELGVTPGKLNLVEKLQEAAGKSNLINIEEWLNKPVKEILKATKEYKQQSQEALKNDTEINNDAAEETTVAEENQKATNDDVLAKEKQKQQKKEQKALEKEQKDHEKALKKQQKTLDRQEKTKNEKEKAQNNSNQMKNKADSAHEKSKPKTEAKSKGGKSNGKGIH